MKNKKNRTNDGSNKSRDRNPESKVSRRDVVRGMATVPVLGALAVGSFAKKRHDRRLKDSILANIPMNRGLETQNPPVAEGKTINIGIIGFGNRGPSLAGALGFVHPERVEKWKQEAAVDYREHQYRSLMEQEDLNVRVTAVCDIFEVYAKRAQVAGANSQREGAEFRPREMPKIFKHYRELLRDDNVDAVVIATPDHWHAPMAIDAARAGKHVYCEKPMAWSVEETYELRQAVTDAGIVFQLGHQGRQTESYIKAKEAIENNVLGKVNLIEVTTNRNSPNGAWIYPIHPEANENTIDWKQFIGQAPFHDFSLERFFRWRCWWDYSTGLFGDLLTHEYDAMNQIFDFGIPDSAVSSGGIYHFKDGRTVPDVMHAIYEFEQRDLTMMYSATLANGSDRGKKIMGHDATMEIGSAMTIYADPDSTRYQEKIESEIIDTNLPILSYRPGRKSVDAITSATEKYFAGRGLLYTYRGGKRVDTTHLHVKEFINCIRTGKTPSCSIEQGFEEAIAALMGTIAYREGRRVKWDRENEKII